ncbi:sensor histidine kinase [Amycolatopsis rhizosphaerae]|uniref:histidine kinase n=1 Tax=Amycolatopsis rhizosphaerae TaxID=2053003 RepID=A0A558BEA7_9PSEU|nr:sensor histidine kinase [Amycolatopsis rhizosphaerae]TVT34829.1 sensor histidine kinase [Amycolatopsis rhizosphaerae]
MNQVGRRRDIAVPDAESETGRRIGPARSLPRRGDVLLAAVVTTVGVAMELATYHRLPWVPGGLVAAAGGACVAWWRVRPTAALLAVFLMYVADTVLGVMPVPVFFPLLITFVAAVVFGDRRVAHAVLVAGYLVAVDVPVPGWRAPTVTSAAGLAAWFLVLAASAEIIRARRQARRAQAAELATEAQARQEQALRRAGEERLRIARDLHDVLAHQLALITVQANVGLTLLPRDPRATEQALTAIKDAGNSALGELRSVLDTLRASDDAQTPPRPSPRISRSGDLVELFEGARAAGLGIEAHTDGALPPLPTPVDQAAYRIIQEAVTNAIRHAGAGTGIAVHLACRTGRLELTVTDDGAGSPITQAPGGRNGLPGMRERAIALGGTFTAGPLPGRGYRVVAALPIREDAAS